MPRFAQIDSGIVTGIVVADTPPTIHIPAGRTYVDISDLPTIRGGESYDSEHGVFGPIPTNTWPSLTLEDRIDRIERYLGFGRVV